MALNAVVLSHSLDGAECSRSQSFTRWRYLFQVKRFILIVLKRMFPCTKPTLTVTIIVVIYILVIAFIHVLVIVICLANGLIPAGPRGLKLPKRTLNLLLLLLLPACLHSVSCPQLWRRIDWLKRFIEVSRHPIGTQDMQVLLSTLSLHWNWLHGKLLTPLTTWNRSVTPDTPHNLGQVCNS